LSYPTKRHTLGRQLAELRIAAKVHQDAIAAAIGISQGQASKIENGKRRVGPELAQLWAEYLGADAEVTEHLVAQARQADTEVTAWQEHFGAGWDEYQKSYAQLEESAVAIHAYQVSVIPGLLQAPGYTEFIQRTIVGLSDDQVNNGLAAMRRRQRLLYQPSTRFSPILAEHVLRHRFPGAAVMVEQLRWLAQLAALPSVDLAVIPTDTDMPLPYMVSFDLFTMPADDVDTVIIEIDTQEIRETDPDRVAVYARRHHDLREQALTGPEAIERVQQIADELTTALFAEGPEG
jgi:transcriptional regulator with XRE-family HTH domain